MKVYRGLRVSGCPVVTIEEKGIHPERQFEPDPGARIVNHSPTDFNWGFSGAGSSQLAFALLFDASDHRRLSEERFQIFQWDVVSQWGEEWSITDVEILSWLVGVQIPIPIEWRSGP